MSAEQRYLSLISGRTQGVGPALARLGLLALEPAYRGAVSARNALFDCGMKTAHGLGRPVVSVGNITTGGTGKTPVVQWLAKALAKRGHEPAVLLRGYRSHEGVSDEASLYVDAGIECEANPDRIQGAADILKRRPTTSVFILDDGFQHRRAKRCFDLVLIDATNPFGHGHTLPRGLLREPPSGLARAQAILITRVDPDVDLTPLLAQLRVYAPTAMIAQSRHVVRAFVDAADKSITTANAGRVLAMSGIGNPEGFHQTLRTLGANVVKAVVHSDHHHYGDADLRHLIDHRGAYDTIVTTEKDWVKLKRLASASQLPFARAQLAIDFADGDENRLLMAIEGAIASAATGFPKIPR